MPLSQGPWINSELWANGLAEWKVRDYDLAVLSKHTAFLGLPDGSAGNESACNAGNTGLIPGLGRSPGEVNGNPLQYSCLENPTNRGAWRATVHGVSKNQTWLSTTHSTSWLYQFTFPPTVQEGLLFSTSSPAFIVCRCFGDGLSDRCAVITLCSFDFSFL